MRHNHGFSLMELVIIMGVAGILAAVTVPSMMAAVERNKIITGSELVAAQIREARLAAVTRNTPFRVRFDCPTEGAVRVLAVTGNAAVDNAGDRCTTQQPNDGSTVYLPFGATFGDQTPPTLQVDGRGEVTLVGGGALPTQVSVVHGQSSRALTITAAGRVTIPHE